MPLIWGRGRGGRLSAKKEPYHRPIIVVQHPSMKSEFFLVWVLLLSMLLRFLRVRAPPPPFS